MSSCHKAAKPLSRCLQQAQGLYNSNAAVRSFSTNSARCNEAVAEAAAVKLPNPLIATSKKSEKILMEHGVLPVGSRRRRAALQTSENIPFEQLPYQCFQEARKILQADRAEKLKEIEVERERINRLVARDASEVPGGEVEKQNRLLGMRKYLEKLKILADINDPLIKKRFEDGEGDMNKPIYRYLADKKWRSYQYKIIDQRVQQLNIVPDVLPHFDPTADVRLAFGRHNVQHGEFVDSRISEIPARLKLQVFDGGERLVSVIVVDTDVPLVDEDWFTSRAHYIACNIPVSPTQTSLPLGLVNKESQLVLPWLPPFAQKGSPYHRYSVFVLEQQPGQVFDVAALKEKTQRDAFHLRGFVDRHRVKPIGVGIFRAVWDEGTASVMQKHNIEGADIEFKRKKIEALKPKQKARGWDAKHAGPKYSWLRK